MLNVVTPITFCARTSPFFVEISGNMAISRLNPLFQGGSNGIQHSISGEMWTELRRIAYKEEAENRRPFPFAGGFLGAGFDWNDFGLVWEPLGHSVFFCLSEGTILRCQVAREQFSATWNKFTNLEFGENMVFLQPWQAKICIFGAAGEKIYN